MTLDIKGSLKNNRINTNIYIFIDELLSNAIDSFLIRKNTDKDINNLKVTFNIEFFPKNLDQDNQYDLKVTCIDNGAGFGDKQIKAFVTKDTSYKDDLAIEGIGKCKGSGRIQFFHYFSKINIDSIYLTSKGLKCRKLSYDSSIAKEIDENSFIESDTDINECTTTIDLDIIKPDIHRGVFKGKNLLVDFSAQSLFNYVIMNFLQRFVSLKRQLGDFEVVFNTTFKDKKESTILKPTDLPDITDRLVKTVIYKEDINKKETFTISHYKLSKTKYNLRKNFIALCAKSSAAKVITSKYLKTKKLENDDISGFYHIILIESDYLDEHVNEQRDNFEIPLSSDQKDIYLQNLLSFEEIYNEIDETIHEMLTPPDWDREKIVDEVTKEYGITANMISEARVRVHYGDTKEKVVKRVLNSYQDKMIKDTSDIFDIKTEISNSDPTDPRFREKVNALAWKYTSSLKSLDIIGLSQTIVRRAAIVEILDMATKKDLFIQTSNTGRRYDEKIIHSIFFPMGADNTETKDHDVWLLSEEFHYFDHIFSDQPLSKIKWDDTNFLFDEDVDTEMDKILSKNYNENKRKRPDIALFNKEGSAVIVEFKDPDASLDEHIGDLMEYSQLLAAKSKGKLRKFYGYLIGKNINSNRLTGYTRFPSGKGWFNTENIIQHETNNNLGQLYSEILYYEDIVDKATKRIDVYKNKLGITF